jgi:hypothetical protein
MQQGDSLQIQPRWPAAAGLAGMRPAGYGCCLLHCLESCLHVALMLTMAAAAAACGACELHQCGA